MEFTKLTLGKSVDKPHYMTGRVKKEYGYIDCHDKRFVCDLE